MPGLWTVGQLFMEQGTPHGGQFRLPPTAEQIHHEDARMMHSKTTDYGTRHTA